LLFEFSFSSWPKMPQSLRLRERSSFLAQH